MRITFFFIIFSLLLLAENPLVIHPNNGKFSPQESQSWQNADYPLGAHFQEGTATFAVYSRNANKVVLEVYEKPYGEDARYRYEMKRGNDHIWRAKISTSPTTIFYGFRLWGPNWPYQTGWQTGNSAVGFIEDVDSKANRFNPNKVVLDPYCKEISHDKSNLDALSGETPEIFGTGSGIYNGVIRREIDSGRYAPKSILFPHEKTSFYKPQIAPEDAIIYEAHVRGITKHPSAARLQDILHGIPGMEKVANVPTQYQGTYRGASYIAPYLKALGFTTIELLPIHETDNDANPDDSPGGNYWGYQTFSYFAPDRRYSYDKSPGGPTAEFKNMVKAFHDAGLEVYIDVVYNHTGEGGIWEKSGESADILAFRGLDNAEYYAIPNGAPHAYWESTGCGNNLDASSHVVQTLILDSLKYWIEEMGVDGFRFDLATVLGRNRNNNYNFQSDFPLLRDIVRLGDQTNTEMVAEAWDISTYQVGQFPYGWSEWNGIYRDAVRRFIRGGGVATGFTDVFNGSYHLFQNQGGPHRSVNFITAHDGFTLMDLVSYNKKNNKLLWPFGPSDGGNNSNDSWDHAGNHELRRQQLRNLWVIQTFARGVPMAVWGDEFARTQNGNNNPYNIDSVATWSNYDMIASDTPTQVATGSSEKYHDNFGKDGQANQKNDLFLFVRNILNLRHKHSCLRQTSFNVPYHFRKANGDMLSGNDRALRVHIDGSATGDDDFLLLMNFWSEKVNFTIPGPDSNKKWHRIVDTASWAESSGNIWESNSAVISENYSVTPYSIVVLKSSD